MKTNMRKMSQAGFSLVELMVVVAIIGILAAVAIPNFNKFQRKARASEGKTLLSAFYNANKTFYAEWEGYTSDLTAMGFSADGTIKSDGASGADIVPAAYTAARPPAVDKRGKIVTIGAMCPDPVFAPGCKKDASLPAGPITAGAIGPGPSPLLFTFNVNTNVGSGTDEVWSIDDKKTLVLVADGINK